LLRSGTSKLRTQSRIFLFRANQVDVVMHYTAGTLGQALRSALHRGKGFHHEAARLGDALVRPHSAPQKVGGNKQQNRACYQDAVAPQEVVFHGSALRQRLSEPSADHSLVNGNVAQ
jgi:hypothetical protein